MSEYSVLGRANNVRGENVHKAYESPYEHRPESVIQRLQLRKRLKGVDRAICRGKDEGIGHGGQSSEHTRRREKEEGPPATSMLSLLSSRSLAKDD